MWQSLTHFLPHMKVDQTFQCTRLNEAIRDCDELRRPDSRSLFRHALSYCIETGWKQLCSTQLATTA